MSNWKVMKLSEVATIVGGGTPSSSKSEYFENGNIPWITPKDLSGYNKRYISEGERNITELGLKNSSAKLLPKNTVLLTSRAPIGYVAIASNEISTNQGFKSLVLNDGHIPEFFYYLLKNNVHILESRATGSTFKEISGQILKDTELSIPTPDIQQKIVDILSPLDDKIELNTQINQTLEQIAQALFKSWFVDFNPVRAKVQALSDGLSLEQAELAAMQAISGKTPEELTALSQTQPDRYAELAETAKAFPCEMVEVSNSIYIPKGWKIKYFNEIIDTYIDNRGKTPPIEKQGIPLLEVKHLPKNSVFPDLNTTKYISNDTYENWLRNKPEALDIMLSTVGTVGRVNLVPTNNKIAIAQNILGFRFNLEKATQIYMFYLMKSEKFIFDMEARIVETVQKSIKRKDLEKIPLLIPTLELQNLFSKFVIPFVIKQNNSENTNLEKIRNDLLPKLLSGEIQL